MCKYLLLIFFFIFPVRMDWITGDTKQPFLKLKQKVRIHHVAWTISENSCEELTRTVIEMQRLRDIEEAGPENQNLLRMDKSNGLRKLRVDFETNTDKLKIDLHCYQNNWYIKDSEVDLKKKQNDRNAWQN